MRRRWFRNFGFYFGAWVGAWAVKSSPDVTMWQVSAWLLVMLVIDVTVEITNRDPDE